MLPITDETFNQEVEEYQGIVIIDFWAEWCSPCKAFIPILEEVSKTLQKSNVKIMSMNIDECPDTPTRLGIRSIPTLMMFKNGKHIDTKVGALKKTLIVEWIEQYTKD